MIRDTIREMFLLLHLATHLWRTDWVLLFDLEDGGGMSFYLGCPKCKYLKEIDRYEALEIRKSQVATHVDDFLNE